MTTIVPPHETGRVNRPGTRPETARPSWEDRAACLNRYPERWDDDATPAQKEKARATCLECPVFAQCLAAGMAAEKGRGAGRAGMKAALTAEQRHWLQGQESKRGVYDAEEARLLALEAKVSGRPVEDIAAREGVEDLTLALAVRFGEPVPLGPKPRPYRSTRLSPLERATARVEDIARWSQEGQNRAEIAKRLHVNKDAVKEALETYLAQHPELVELECARERAWVEEIARLRETPLDWREIDARLGRQEGATYRAVLKWRNAAEKRGEPVPACLARDAHLLSDGQVVRIRERAQAGVLDAVQAEEYQVSRTQISRIVTGDQYKNVGGPIRAKRVTSQTRIAGSSQAASYGMAS